MKKLILASALLMSTTTFATDYDWHQNHLTTLQDANVFAVLWGGGNTTSVLQLSTDSKIANPWLVEKVKKYEQTPVNLGTKAKVQDMPNYIAMGTITVADDAGYATNQLNSQKLDISFHYEGNGAGDRGHFADEPYSGNNYSYIPEVHRMAEQARAVTTTTGHQLIAAEVFYTIDFSDGAWAISQDTEVDDNLTRHIYNLMIESQLMQKEYDNGQPMILFLNPDSVWSFQGCSLNYCPSAWKKGLALPVATTLVAAPNLITDFDVAIDRMVANEHLTQEQANIYKINIQTAIPLPSSNLRDTYGLPEIVQTYNFIVKSFAPNVPFGWGLNAYDNANPQMNPKGQYASWETSAISWIHKVNYDNNYLQDLDVYGQPTGAKIPVTTDAAIKFESQKLAQYIQEMNFAGGADDNYKPDFIYFDIYERDPIRGDTDPSLNNGFLFNGVDWDAYLKYIKYTDQAIGNLPVALWQMPGASLQTVGNSQGPDHLGSTVPDWVFGDPTLNNDFSNIDPSLGVTGLNTKLIPSTNYFTSNLGVANAIDYLKLSAQQP